MSHASYPCVTEALAKLFIGQIVWYTELGYYLNS